MIHSMSGGVIADGEVYTFAKVEVEGAPYWYLAPDSVKEGDAVLVPFGKSGALQQGVVKKVERGTRQTAPYPMNRISSVEAVL